MWLYVPTISRSSTSRPAPACSARPSESPSAPSDCEVTLWAVVSGIAVQRPLSWPAWKRRPYIRFLSGTTQTHSTLQAGVDSLTSSLRDIRASRSLVPARAVATAILATFGRPAVERLRESNPASCFWRTSTRTYVKALGKSLGLCDEWVIALRRDSLRRRKSARATRESGCSFLPWPTPNTHPEAPNNSKTREAGRIAARTTNQCLDQVAKNWPTPTAADGSKGPVAYARGNPSLGSETKNWAIPTRRDWKVGELEHREGGRALTTDAETFPTTHPQKATSSLGRLLQVWTPPECPRLNPRFAEWLMGWPAGLTSFDLSETEWTLWRRRMRFLLCSLVLRNNTERTLQC